MAASARSPLHRLRRAGGALLTAAAVVLAAIVLVPALLGFQRYVITSGSMTGTYDRGSLLYDRVVPTSTLEVGDVVTYDPPQGAPGLVTHRIASIDVQPNGTRVFRTKGDANPTADPWTFTLSGQTQAKAAFHLPYAGYALAALGDRRLRMLIIGVPALLVAISVLAGLWREAGEATAEVRRA
ncbi:MAG TPA: signal peptidase I [Solirubrobacteraceae bacterium]|nr:signal peptidase I [Solirubrobacteraceae bacterium]